MNDMFGIRSPLQGFERFALQTQGVALGCGSVPLLGRKTHLSELSASVRPTVA